MEKIDTGNHRDGVCVGRTEGVQIQKGLVQVLLATWWLPCHPEFYPTRLGKASAGPGRGCGCHAGLTSSGDDRRPHASRPTRRSGPRPPEPCHCGGNRSPERGSRTVDCGAHSWLPRAWVLTSKPLLVIASVTHSVYDCTPLRMRFFSTVGTQAQGGGAVSFS